MNKLKKMYIILPIFLVLVLSITLPCLIEQTPTEDDDNETPTKMELSYAVVSYTLMGNKGLIDEIRYINQKSANHIFMFWFNKAHKHCVFNKKLTESAKEVIYSQVDFRKKETQTTARKEFSEYLEYCYEDFIYNNWKKINKTIKNTYKREKKKRCPYCLIYKVFY